MKQCNWGMSFWDMDKSWSYSVCIGRGYSIISSQRNVMGRWSRGKGEDDGGISKTNCQKSARKAKRRGLNTFRCHITASGLCAPLWFRRQGDTLIPPRGL